MKRVLKHKTVLLTGANGGLGVEFVKLLLSLEAYVLAIDLSFETLERNPILFSNPLLQCIKLDLAQEVEVKNWLLTIPKKIDLFINNAGITQIKTVKNQQLQLHKKLFQINYFTPVLITHLLFNKNNSIGVINMNSVAGFAPLYARSSYVASKHALRGFMQTFRLEEKIEILNAYPSFIKTGIRKAALEVKDSKNRKALEPKLVIGKILSAWRKGENEVRIGFEAKAAYLLNKIFPKIYQFFMLKSNRKEWMK